MQTAASRYRHSVAPLALALLGCAATPPRPPSIPARADETTASFDALDTGSVPPFNRQAAARALSAVEVASCATADGPSGPGHVTIVMATDGGAAAVHADGPYEDTLVGKCVEEKFRGVRVPAFSGAPMPIGKQFRLP